jgi:hypothetical protein
MDEPIHVKRHRDFESDLDGLEGSLRKQADKKIHAIETDAWQGQGHRLKGDLLGFRSADFQGQTYKIIFSYCSECRKQGRNARFIGNCEFCSNMADDAVIFWRIIRHSGGERNGYRIVSKAMAKDFPPSP